jgi:uncharacterized membrane protein (DUF2068 family)
MNGCTTTSFRESTIARVRRERGLVLIIAYKFVKGGLWFVFAVVLVVLMRMGLGDRLLGFADHLRHHAHAWSLELARLVVRAATRRGLWTVVVALVADGTLSVIEAWALLHGRWWGPWIVVVSTGSLLPFEVVSLARHPHAVRAAILALNLAIVAYLIRKVMRERGINSDQHARGSAQFPRGTSPPA